MQVKHTDACLMALVQATAKEWGVVGHLLQKNGYPGRSMQSCQAR